MDSPQNHIWGPALWFLLHSSVERYGYSVSLPDEEKRIWNGLLRSLQYSLPCPLCKKHYTAYLASHPLVFTKEELRSWLYQLHCEVNQRTDKQTTVTIEKMEEIYGIPFQFTRYYPIIVKQMMMALRMGWSTREDVQRSIRFFEEIKRYYDFF
jgi:Erv1 / Alr family